MKKPYIILQLEGEGIGIDVGVDSDKPAFRIDNMDFDADEEGEFVNILCTHEKLGLELVIGLEPKALKMFLEELEKFRNKK